MRPPGLQAGECVSLHNLRAFPGNHKNVLFNTLEIVPPLIQASEFNRVIKFKKCLKIPLKQNGFEMFKAILETESAIVCYQIM